MTKKISSLNKESLPSESTPVQIVPPQSWSPYAGEDDTIDLFELINTLWKRKLLILVISLLSLAGSFVSTQFLPKTYTSSVLFEYPDWKELAQSVKNPIILDGIVRRNQIIKKFLPHQEISENSSGQISPEQKAVQLLLGKDVLKIELNENSLTELTVQWHDPTFAAELANLLPEQLRIETRLRKIEALRKEENQLDIERELLKDYEKPIQNQINQLISEYPQLLLFSRNSERDEISELETALGERLSNLSILENSSEIENSRLIREVEQLREMIGQVSLGKGELYLKRIEFDRLNSELNGFNQRLNAIEKRIFEIKKFISLDDSSFLVYLTEAIPPEVPSKPKVRLIVALSGVVGLFFAIFLCFTIEFVKNFQNQKDLTLT